MRKPVYLAVLGVSIVVAAGALGVTLTRYLSLRAYAPISAARAAAPVPAQAAPAPPPEQWNNLFAPKDGMKMASRLPAANGKSASQGPRTAYLLVGTIVSSSPAARRAILWANGMKEPKAFREKEEVEPGAILSSVERDKAWISRGKDREKLEILPVGSRTRPTAIPAVPPSAAASPDTTPRPGPAASLPPPPGRSPASLTDPSAAPEEDVDDSRTRYRSRRSRGSRL